MKKKDNLFKDATNYRDLAHVMRGKVIDLAINLELVMDDYIADYFCTSDQIFAEFKQLFFYDKNMGWSRKKEIFEFIIKNHDTDLLKKYPTILKEIGEIIAFRNSLAHRFLDFTKDAVKKAKPKRSIILLNNKTAVETELTQNETERICDLIKSYITAIMYWDISKKVANSVSKP